ncbi:N-acetylmuramoyl-L-alanine amidase [Paenibacillus sp. 481]|uniref:N-acetylmuramoyl-L-alanine amidase n=1 Tax=Paenibacillus sp. 481 TaxID=2835869 RepID=UPI001E2DD748|nr:N-acetylmuramoyl-L-alanine amidase [Paenibacillus sp. 481]UHA72679.1 N-acetylmuramoyl-L-alanine amidase [Paenibacillus sp. 481]
MSHFTRLVTKSACALLLLTTVQWSAYGGVTRISAEPLSHETAIMQQPKQPQQALNTHSPNNLSSAFPQRVVIIDAGHGGIDGGTKYGDLLEKDINLAIAQKLYLLLRSKGIPTILNRTGDYALSDDNRWSQVRSRHQRDLAQRRQLSKEIPTSLFVSIHVNWTKNQAKRGPIILHKDEGRSKMLAWVIQQSLNPLYEVRNSVEVGSTYYLLRRVEHPAVIVETGFISNEADRQLLTSAKGQATIASRICDALIHFNALF